MQNHQTAKEHLDDRMGKATSERGRTYFRLEWLIVHEVISIDQIWWLGFVHEGYSPLSPWGRIRKWIAKKLGRERVVIVPDDPTRERRKTRRIAAQGQTSLTLDEGHGAAPPEWTGQLVDVSSGGARFLLKSRAPGVTDIPGSRFHLETIDGPLEGVKSESDCRNAETVEVGLCLHLEWVDPPDATGQKIVEYVRTS